MKVHSLLATLVLVATGVAYAQAPAAGPATPRIDQREANQERRIQQGVASGQLTPREAQRLERGEQRIERTEDRAKADGKVTPQERQHLERMQNKESRDIRREKHDKQRDMNHDGKRDTRNGHENKRPGNNHPGNNHGGNNHGKK